MKKVPVPEPESRKAKERSTFMRADDAADARRVDADDELAKLQADLDRFRDLAMRSQADFENYKKRCAREKDDAIKYANKNLLEKLRQRMWRIRQPKMPQRIRQKNISKII